MKNKKQFITVSKEVSENQANTNVGNYYPVFIKNEVFEKLLVIQSEPVKKYWFQDREVTIDELIKILSGVAFSK